MAAPKIQSVVVDGETRYKFVVDISPDPETGRRRQVRQTHKRKKDAQRELARILDQVNRGIYVPASTATVKDYLNQWMRSATRHKAEATKRNYFYALLPVIEQYGAKALQKFTVDDVEDLVDWMLSCGRKRGGKPGTGLSARTVQLTLSRLRAALNDAVLRHMVEYNVALVVKCPPNTGRKKVMPWSPEEVVAFLEFIAHDRLLAPILLSLCGLRPAEVCGLRWAEDIDFEKYTISIENTRTVVFLEDGEQVEEKGTKTEAGERRLPMPQPVVSDALYDFRRRQWREREKAGLDYERTGYVLVDELGRPQKTTWLRRNVYRLMEASGVRKVRLYDARHACLTYLAVNGVPDVIVSAWAGHADLGMAKKVYVHPSLEDLKQGSSKLAELLTVKPKDHESEGSSGDRDVL